MQRALISQLIAWKNSQNRKPLVLQGARQVGKTHLLNAFGAQEYKEVVSFNFELTPEIHPFFQSSLEPSTILQKLEILTGRKIVPSSSLIVFDEIQACPQALTSLKYFCEKAPEYHLVCAGSLLGIGLKANTSFPVGKVNFLTLFPLSFEEFLVASGKELLSDYLYTIGANDRIDTPFHNELSDLFKIYLYTGGMPEAVDQYLKSKDLIQVRVIQQEILTAYVNDFSKHLSPQETLKVRLLWDSAPSQLARENKKFIFSAVAKSARARDYDVALQWLFDASLLLKARLVENPGIPLDIVASQNAYKCFFLDVGLLSARLKVEQSAIVIADQLLSQYRGALAENLVAEELTANGLTPLYYWTSQSQAELDFVVEIDGIVVPVEVKSGLNRKSKSLSVFTKKYGSQAALRISSGPFGVNNNIIDLPFYMIAHAERLTKEISSKSR